MSTSYPLKIVNTLEVCVLAATFYYEVFVLLRIHGMLLLKKFYYYYEFGGLLTDLLLFYGHVKQEVLLTY